jgi:anti-sigma factor ChrR (cupin superfamily)
MRTGVLEQKFLLTGQDGTPNNYLLNVGRTGSGGWSTPRHRHNFDQIRYVIKGTYPYAKGKSMPEGWVGYFPEAVHYGPQDRPEGLEMMVCQFGGASGNGYLSVTQREAANEALKKKGEFKNGVFSYFDKEGKRHNQDGFEACYEEAMGRELTYSKPRYDDLIMMDPSCYEWIPETTHGVSTKWLGSFTERNTRVALTRVEAGATFPAGEQSSIELLFLSKGLVSLNGREYGPHSAFEFLANEGPIPLKAVAQSEFFRIVLPQF